MDDSYVTFPDPDKEYPHGGLLAYGGDLNPSTLWAAYSQGIFPWYNPGEDILWWCPDPRFVLFPEKLKISKSMKKIMVRNVFQFTENKAFREVLEHCMHMPREGQEGTWMSVELMDSLEVLHRTGKALSYEVWQDGRLVGGLYGILVGKVFCGESMFSLEPNASKAGLISFVERHKEDIKVIDCQVHSTHLESMGAEMIPKKEFLSMITART